MLQGSVEDSLVVTIMDTRNNILERFQLEVKELRVMYPYHLRVRFRE